MKNYRDIIIDIVIALAGVALLCGAMILHTDAEGEEFDPPATGAGRIVIEVETEPEPVYTCIEIPEETEAETETEEQVEVIPPPMLRKSRAAKIVSYGALHFPNPKDRKRLRILVPTASVLCGRATDLLHTTIAVVQEEGRAMDNKPKKIARRVPDEPWFGRGERRYVTADGWTVSIYHGNERTGEWSEISNSDCSYFNVFFGEEHRRAISRFEFEEEEENDGSTQS